MQHTVHNSTQQIEAVYETHVPFVMCTIVVDRSLHWKSMTSIRYHRVWNILSDITQKIAKSKTQKLLILKENVGQMIRVGHSLYPSSYPLLWLKTREELKPKRFRLLAIKKICFRLVHQQCAKVYSAEKFRFFDRKSELRYWSKRLQSNRSSFAFEQYFTPWVRAWFDLDAIARELNVIQFFICQCIENIMWPSWNVSLINKRSCFFLEASLTMVFANITW